MITRTATGHGSVGTAPTNAITPESEKSDEKCQF
jgi:hypothetical protein